MPQASERLRKLWPGGDTEAIAYLESRGYVLGKDFRWTAPAGVTQPTARDWSAICYLIDEWDFGSVLNVECNIDLREIRG